MAMTAMKPLPRAMLIDMDDTILSAYGRPEIAWNTIATEFAAELAPLPPERVAAAVLTFARNFWANVEAAWCVVHSPGSRFCTGSAQGHHSMGLEEDEAGQSNQRDCHVTAKRTA